MSLDYADVYGRFHENQKLFPGYTVCRYVQDIADLVSRYEAKSLIDYGCGKGYQYLARRIHEKWGGILPHCYDIGVRQLNEAPTGLFDGLICVDVLEHIEEVDLFDTIRSMEGLVRSGGFMFLAVSCRPSKNKDLPDGRNVHVTVKPPEWWDARIGQIMRELSSSVNFHTAYEVGI